MNQMTVLEQLISALQKMPSGDAILQEMEEKYGPDMTRDQAIYWLDESGFSLSAWRKKHLEEGETEKAQEEQTRLEVISKALDLLQKA